jgi:hypothetical protein
MLHKAESFIVFFSFSLSLSSPFSCLSVVLRSGLHKKETLLEGEAPGSLYSPVRTLLASIALYRFNRPWQHLCLWCGLDMKCHPKGSWAKAWLLVNGLLGRS